MVKEDFKGWKKGFSKRINTRISKYVKTGQLKQGAWFCKAGWQITAGRIHKYEGMCHHLVKKFLPARALYEASMDYDDLVNQCRLEVFMALLDGFDPVKAMTSKIEDPSKRAESIENKLVDPQKTLEKAESSIVYGRLQNYLRRTRWGYHPDQYGGRSQSLEELTEEDIHQEFRNNCYRAQSESSSVIQDKEKLLEIVETQGVDAAKKVLDQMGTDRVNAIIECMR